MLTIAIFTYKRLDALKKCLNSLDSDNISEIIIFNDNEEKKLSIEDITLTENKTIKIQIYNPADFGFNDRNFRKPFYINQVFEIPPRCSTL